MTKTEVHKQALAILKTHKAPEGLVKAMDTLLVPKKAGQAVDIETIVKRDGDGTIVQLKCRLSGKFLPADTNNFPPYKGNEKLNNLWPVSRIADKLKKDAAKMFAASKAAITQDVLDEVIKPSVAKTKLNELQKAAETVDYSSVKAWVKPVATPATEADAKAKV